MDNTDGRTLCPVCDVSHRSGVTLCPDCGGIEPENCDTCHGGGVCPWCDGYGFDETLDEDCTMCSGFGGDPKASDNFDEPVWYSLSGVIEVQNNQLPQGAWRELMELAQLLHDLRIDDSNQLMRKLGAVYIADDSKPLEGEYHYIGGNVDPGYPDDGQAGWDRWHEENFNVEEEAKKPQMSSRRQAIMAQKKRRNNEGS